VAERGRWPNAEARARRERGLPAPDTARAGGARRGGADARGTCPYLRFEPAAQEFSTRGGGTSSKHCAPRGPPGVGSHVSNIASLMPSLALIGHLIDAWPAADRARSRRRGGPAVGWCTYLQGHARRLYASVTDRRAGGGRAAGGPAHARAAAQPVPARDVYRNEWTGPDGAGSSRGALACLAERGGLRRSGPDPRGGRPAVRFRINRGSWRAGLTDRARHSGGFPPLLTSPRSEQVAEVLSVCRTRR